MLSSWTVEDFNTPQQSPIESLQEAASLPNLKQESRGNSVCPYAQCLHHLQVAVGAIRHGNRSHLLLQNPSSRRHPPLSSSDRPQQWATRRELLVQAGSPHQVSRLHRLDCFERSIFSRFFARSLQLKSRAQCPQQQQRRLRRSIRCV